MSPQQSPEVVDPRFRAHDRQMIIRHGWIPVTNVPVLEELRAEHERFLAQRDAEVRNVNALHERFEAEDRAKQAALDAAYRNPGSEPKPVEVTSEDERKRLREEAVAKHTAAVRALLSFGYDAVDRLRGDQPHPRFNGSEAANMGVVPPAGDAAKVLADIDTMLREASERAAEARRVIEEAGREARAFGPLRAWLIKTANAGVVGAHALVLGAEIDFDVPTHTPGAKPREMDVPGWWPYDNREARVEDIGDPENASTPVRSTDDDEFDRSVDTSDEWFRERDTEAV